MDSTLSDHLRRLTLQSLQGVRRKASGTRVGGWQAHDGFVDTVKCSADGATLATGGADRTVALWDLATSKRRVRMAGHTGNVVRVAFSDGGRTLVSGAFRQDG